MFRAVHDGKWWRVIRHKELKRLISNPDTVTELKCEQIRWLGHVWGVKDSRPLKEMLNENP